MFINHLVGPLKESILNRRIDCYEKKQLNVDHNYLSFPNIDFRNEKKVSPQVLTDIALPNKTQKNDEVDYLQKANNNKKFNFAAQKKKFGKR